MSMQGAKRRREEFATSSLSKPFRSPFKPIIDKTTKDSQEQQYTTSQHKVSITSIAKYRSPFQYNRQYVADPSSRTTTIMNSQLEIGSLLNVQRQLKKKLYDLKEELHLMEQAHKIENDPLDTRSEGAEVDSDLLRLTKSWKTASRQAAEELFGGAKDRVNRTGGLRVWKGLQQEQLEYQSRFNNETLQSNSPDGEDGYGGVDAERRIDPETQEKRGSQDGNDACEDWNEDVRLHDVPGGGYGNKFLKGVHNVDDVNNVEH